MENKTLWKITSFILLALLIIVIFWGVLKFKTDEAYVDGYNQGQWEIIGLNTLGRFNLWNDQTNQTVEYTIGNICSSIYGS